MGLRRSSRGARGVGIICSALLALITSLIRYGLVAAGGTVYDTLLCRLGTQNANIAVRRVAGAARSARLEVLRVAAHVTSERNLFI